MTGIDDLTRAPWTPAEVRRLNEWQTCGWCNPYTCGQCRDRLGTVDDDGVHNDRRLVATDNGWMCPTCDNAQEWAWVGMVAGPPADPFASWSNGLELPPTPAPVQDRGALVFGDRWPAWALFVGGVSVGFVVAGIGGVIFG